MSRVHASILTYTKCHRRNQYKAYVPRKTIAGLKQRILFTFSTSFKLAAVNEEFAERGETRTYAYAARP